MAGKLALPKRAAICVALALLSVLPGCDASPQSFSSSGRENSLVVYTPHREEIYEPIIKEFQERTGIWVEVEYAPTSEALSRIRREEDAPRCDVIFGGGVESLEANKECFQPYRTAEYDAIGQTFRSQDDSWTAFSALPLVIVYNTRLMSGGDIPTRWEDLADPRWKGRVAFANPVASGSCYTTLATALQIYGEDGWDYAQRFAENLDGLLLGGSADIIPGVVDGEYMLGIALEESATRYVTAGADLGIRYPKEGTSAVPDGSAIVKNAPHPENAKLFIDFTVSPEVQSYLAAQMSRRPVRTDIASPKSLPALSEVKIITYDFAWASQSKDEILARWQETLAE